METLTTNGIKVSVESFYHPHYSKPRLLKFYFAYRITIENQSKHIVQLLRRRWEIADSNGIERVVEGDGVIGQQPVLHPGDQHQYVSGCPLTTEIGRMRGHYEMIRKEDKYEFIVNVPEFKMVAPFKKN